MSPAVVGEVVTLPLVLADRASGFYPKARVYNGPTLVATLTLTEVGGGYYSVNWTAPAPGNYVVVYDVYDDALHTTLSLRYDTVEDELQVLELPTAGQTGSVRQAFTLDATSNAIIVNVWLEVDGAQQPTGVTNASMTLYNHLGVIIASPSAQASPVGQGVFRFSFPIPGFALGENATFSVASLDYAGPPIRTVRGVTGVTFSRSA